MIGVAKAGIEDGCELIGQSVIVAPTGEIIAMTAPLLGLLGTVLGMIQSFQELEMAEGAAILAGMGYDMIDVNLACPVKKIRKRNRGGNFLAHPDQAIDVLRAVREAVDPSIPCSVKLRRAYNDTPEMARNFDRIFDFTYETPTRLFNQFRLCWKV